MTLRHMKIFLAVCQNGCNVTRAAESLYLAQPAVSAALAELEGYYGVKLFDRLSRRLYITEAGKRLLAYATHIAALYDDMEKGLRDWDALGVLRVGSSITIGSQLLPGYVKAFRGQYPNITVHVRIGRSERLEERLLRNELDFALTEGITQDRNLVNEEYQEDELAVIAPGDGSFPPGAVLTVDNFLSHPILLREHGSGTREVFDSVLASAGRCVEPLWESVSTSALVNAVANGLGLAVLPLRMLREPLERGVVVRIQVQGLCFTRRFRILYHRHKFLTPAARAFLELCRGYETMCPKKGYTGLF